MSSASLRATRVVPCVAALVFALVIALALVSAPLSQAKGGGNGGGPPDHAAAAQQANSGGGSEGNGGGDADAPAPAAADDRREPATKPAAKPAKPAAESAAKPAAKPDAEPAAKPAAQPDRPKPANAATHVAKPAVTGNPGAIQGNSPSDPDGDTNGGADKPGFDGGFTDDKDGNNGCGNDDDFEDDNRGRCGGNPAKPDKDRPANGGGAPGEADGDKPDAGKPMGDTPDGGKPAGDTPDADGSDRGNSCPLAVKVLTKALALLGIDMGLDCAGASDRQPGEADGPAPKVTICHATGSATNPFVEITISENGLNGHDGHEGDLIPMPAGGCPVATAAPGNPGTDTPEETKQDKITICHATGSATNPFVEITISVNGLNGHGDHQGDIIPMPAGGCPLSTTPTTPGGDTPTTPGEGETPTNGGGGSPANGGGDTPSNQGGGETPTAGAGQTPTEAAGGTPGAEAGETATGGETTAGGEGAAGDTAGAEATAGASDQPGLLEDADAAGGQLPFTGLALGTLALLALAAIGGGWLSHRQGGKGAKRAR